MIRKPIIQAVLTLLLAAAAPAATVTNGDPNPGGIGYSFTVQMGGLDTATLSSHVGAWSWQDPSLFSAAAGEPPVGWTHTSNWVALKLTNAAVLKVRMERDANVPWPSAGNPSRLASTSSMYPSFTIWQNWDNDLAPAGFVDENGNPANDYPSYYNRGAVDWAEDLVFIGFAENSTETFVERTYVLQPGNYTLALGSNAPATDSARQGYKATFTTTQDLPISLGDDLYFTSNAVTPLTVPVATGVLVNDVGVAAPGDVLELVDEPTHGQLTLNADGSFTYAPGPYFGVYGYDTFTYHLLIDGDEGSPTPTGTVVISNKAFLAGVYVGHIMDEDTGDISGVVKFNVTAAGAFTVRVQLLGKTYALTGKVAADGEMVLTRKTLDLEGHIAVHDDGDRHAHVHIHGAGGLQHFEATVEKSPFSIYAPPPSFGVHRVALAYQSATGTGASTRNGAGTLTVGADGSAMVVARLGDMTTFSAATAVIAHEGTGPIIPIYAPAYRAPGSVSGTFTFGPLAADNATGALRAVKPAVGPKPGFSIIYDGATTKVVRPVRLRR